mmetsp:Transcript_76286/g.235538  ORF Transcript_76286/g.235538 Transcript_76286/m.235538 type:complete len:517 (+) Transcript_76286:2577-4127(+)
MSFAVLEAFFMCALKASMACDRNTVGVKSSLSAASGAAVSLVSSIFFSRFWTSSLASLSRRLATNLCSWSRSKLLCLSRSPCILVSLSIILLISPSIEESVLLVLASRCLFSRRFRVLVRTVLASCWVRPAFSQAPFISSGGMSATFCSASVFVASVAMATFCSTSSTFSVTSRLMVAIFRSAIPFFVSAKRFDAASKRSCSFPSCSMVVSDSAGASRLAARRFMANTVLVPPTAVWAEAVAASSSVSAALAWSMGRSSPPLTNSASHSATLATASSASFSRSSDSLMMPSTTSLSDRSRMAATAASSRSCTSFTCGWSLASSSLARLCMRSWVSTNLVTVLIATCASAAACSVLVTCRPCLAFLLSSPSFPSLLSSGCSSWPMFSTRSATFVTLSSAAFILPWASSRTFLADKRCSTLDESFLHRPISAAAVVSLLWNLISSALTSADISLPLASICLFVRNFRASVSAAFAVCSALMVSSEAARISLEESSKSLASSSKMAAASETFFTSSSAF